MTRLLIGSAIGFALAIVIGAACGLHAQEIGSAVACRDGVGCTERPELLDEVVDVAAEAGVEPIDLLGAVNTTGLDPRSYLIAEGVLAGPPPPTLPDAPVSPCGWPICGPLGQRIYCVESIESNHGLYMFNAQPWFGEHAQGWLGYLPSTARQWGVSIGNRWSEWHGAAAMIAAGQGRQFFGLSAGIC